MSYHALSKFVDAGSHPIIRQYIKILEGCYVLITAERLNPKTKRGVLRKEKKFYFLDPLVIGALVSWSESGEVQPRWSLRNWKDVSKQGQWIENMVAAELRKSGKVFFYDEQFGGEVDFVFQSEREGEMGWEAIEVKRSIPSSSELKPLSAYFPHARTLVYEWGEGVQQMKHPLCESLINALMKEFP